MSIFRLSPFSQTRGTRCLDDEVSKQLDEPIGEKSAFSFRLQNFKFLKSKGFCWSLIMDSIDVHFSQ